MGFAVHVTPLVPDGVLFSCLEGDEHTYSDFLRTLRYYVVRLVVRRHLSGIALKATLFSPDLSVCLTFNVTADAMVV